MILKSFFRNKTTKIYFFIIIALLSLLGIVIYARYDYVRRGNISYKNARIVLVANKSFENGIRNVSNISEVSIGLLSHDIQDGGMLGVHIFQDESLKDDEIIVSNKNLSGKYTANFYAKDYEFRIEGYRNLKSNLNEVYVSLSIFRELEKQTDDYFYVLKLKDWFKYEKTKNELIDKIKVSEFSDDENGILQSLLVLDGEGNNNYFTFINIYTIASYVVGIFALIIMLITIYNIYVDLDKSNYLYSCLGYKKRDIIKINLLRIGILLGGALIVSVIIVFLFAVLFKHG